MNLRRKFLWLNVGLLLGSIASLLIVPRSTPVWLFATVVIFVGAILNYGILRRQRRVTGGHIKDPTGSRANVIIAAAFVLFVLDVLLTRACRHF